eukprot:TRINITY_DN111_c4_g1_i1.p1 TRINITY_DN111_c4_g1~~TRINITY_DN111_c4_g1_i1.p1  ORF type:complete len:142 (-),score=88.13 TRINITY_DN111_c4_g1_i1:256-681(-)
MATQDFKPLVIRKKKAAPKTTAKPTESKEQQVNRARQQGSEVETVKKYNAGTNKTNSVDTRKIDRIAEDNDAALHIPRVSHNLSLQIQQARTAKGLTQKQLAVLINEKTTVVNDYENSRAIPNGQIITKLQRALDCTFDRN